MKGFRKTVFVSTVLMGMFGTGLAVQTAQAGGGRMFLSFCELCQFKGNTYPWPRYSYHLYRGKRCDARMNTGLYQRYEYDRYQVKSTQPIHGEMLPLPE